MRSITQEDRDNARRLKAIWNLRKDHLNLTQEKAATALGVKQSTISQYLNAHIALNTETVLGFADLLGCYPENIDPRLKGVVPAMEVPIVGSLGDNGYVPAKEVKYVRTIGHLRWIDVDGSA